MMTALPDINTIGVPGTTKESFLQTLSGRLVSVQNPDPRLIDFGDIVAAITKQCRFNGHCRSFYSVGEHTVRGVKIAKRLYPKDLNAAKSFFIHDFTEAYVGDVIRPVKKHLPEFKIIEAGFHDAICEAFSYKEFDEGVVHEIDNIMAMWEKRDLLPSEIHWPGMPNIDALNLPRLVPMSPRAVTSSLYALKSQLFKGVM
jgi:hypothetical protein